MNFRLFTTSAAVMALVVACGGKTEESASGSDLTTTDQRLSYMVGTNMARQFKRDDVALDLDALSLGITDALEEKESRLSEEQIQDTIAAIQERSQERQEQLRAEQEKERIALAEKNKTEGAAYLEANKAKEGVVVTDSGLQYRELVSGSGARPTGSDAVSVHYTGTLIDGTEFDSSYRRNEPATFPVTGVIPGWVEALQLMNVGDKWELTVPSKLAYGPGGTGGAIGPNATLVFEVELLDIVEEEEKPEQEDKPQQREKSKQ